MQNPQQTWETTSQISSQKRNDPKFYILKPYRIPLKITFAISTYIINMSCCDQDHEHQHNNQDHTHTHAEHQQQIIEGQDQEEKLRLKKLKMEKRMREREEIKKKYMPLFKFLKNQGLKFKAAGADKNSIQYFRMDQFKEILETKKDKIQADRNISELLRNWEKIFIYYERLENQPHFKWPQQLTVSRSGPASKFASFPFDTSESSKIKGILIMLGVLVLVLFPLWPLGFKIFIWYVSYYTTMLLVGIIILRLVLYLFFSIFGASIWMFPRLFDNVDFIQSFKPFFTAQKWQGSTIYSILTRVLIFSIFCYYGFHIYNDPLIIQENMNITKTIMDDINDWGLSKIKGEKNFSQSALSDYSKRLNETLQEDEDDDDNDDLQGEEATEIPADSMPQADDNINL